MGASKLTRRRFLRGTALGAAGTLLAACQPKPAAPSTPVPEEPTAAPAAATSVPEPTAAPAEATVLEVMSSNPEYENAERQIWDVYEEENPGAKIDLFSVNEDTGDAFVAKVAGGYVPAFAPIGWYGQGEITKDNYKMFVDLTTVEGIPWERYTHDPLNKVQELLGFPPCSLNPHKGFQWTWIYHADLMEKAGLDPRKDVKTADDLKAFLQAGTEWAKSSGEVDYFWDEADCGGWCLCSQQMQALALMFPDGQQDDMIAAWNGDKPVNGPESPWRGVLEFLKEAYDKGWVPQSFWTREWEVDMEATFISKKSALSLHGPWLWDKAVAANPDVQLLGFPVAPPAAGQNPWVQYIFQPEYLGGYGMLAKAQEKPEWPEIAKAFVWWNLDDAVRMRSEVLGLDTYLEGVEVELDTPQWNGVAKEIAREGGLWQDTKYVDQWLEVEMLATRKPGTPGILDWETGAMLKKLAELMKGETTVDALLDWCQANRDASYEA